jgi:hypothetical protein
MRKRKGHSWEEDRGMIATRRIGVVLLPGGSRSCRGWSDKVEEGSGSGPIVVRRTEVCEAGMPELM